MLSSVAFNQWKRQAHGPRVQAKAICHIAQKMECFDAFSEEIGSSAPTLTEIFRDCAATCTTDVSVNTLRRWWNDFSEWGELPYKVSERKRLLKAANKNVNKNQLIDDGGIIILKRIVDENPNLYLDELTFLFGMTTDIFVHYSTIRRCLVERLGYSLQVLLTIAKQQCEQDEIRFLQAMEMYLQSDAERLITIDETHKDRNAARRRRGWGRKGNTQGVRTKAWFDNVARYTLIAAADINGFIPAACHTVRRDEISDEGAAGTVDAEYFLYWVKEYLFPMLVNYALGEARSVVLMDNASTHMSGEIEEAITATGAIFLYGAPFAPHLNPIELYFSIYKAYLKRNDTRMIHDWYTVHTEALGKIGRDMGINFFRRSKVPGSFLCRTTNELINKIH